MCMEDVRLGRKAVYNVRTLTVPLGTAVEIASPDPGRFAIIISVQTPNHAHVSPFILTPTTDYGIRLTNGQPPLILNVKDHGAMVFDGWRLFADTADCDVTVITSTLGAE